LAKSIYFNSVLFYKYQKCTFYEYPANILICFIKNYWCIFYQPYLSQTCKEVRLWRAQTCSMEKRVLFRYMYILYDNNDFPSLYKIKRTDNRSFVMTCGDTDKASLSILIFSKEETLWFFVHWKSYPWDNLNEMSYHRAWRHCTFPNYYCHKLFFYLELFERQGK